MHVDKKSPSFWSSYFRPIFAACLSHPVLIWRVRNITNVLSARAQRFANELLWSCLQELKFCTNTAINLR